jgi:hypothetical protein
MITYKRIGAGITVCAIVFFAGCGYTTRSMVSTKYRTVSIPQFKNKIDIARETTSSNYRLYRPLLETDITSAIVQKFLTDGNLKPVGKKEHADLVLEGELVDFRKDPLTYTRNNDVNEYRVSISVNLKLTDTAANTVLWEEPSFTGTATYVLSGAQASSESAAITSAIKDLSRRVIERTVDQW